MCEAGVGRGHGWRGWSDIPKPRTCESAGDWVDLTYATSPSMPCASIFPSPSFRKLRSLPQDPFSVTEMCSVVHAGTHVDAPSHYFMDGPDARQIPLDRLHGPGVVWRIAAALDQVIGVEELERCRPALEPGDILALDTGWAARFGTPEYERHPSLNREAAEWLVEQRIKLLACDFATPDLVYHLRQPGFDWPVHHALLSRGILICEHLTGHAALHGRRVEFIFASLAIEDSDGAPARVLARPVVA